MTIEYTCEFYKLVAIIVEKGLEISVLSNKNKQQEDLVRFQSGFDCPTRMVIATRFNHVSVATMSPVLALRVLITHIWINHKNNIITIHLFFKQNFCFNHNRHSYYVIPYVSVKGILVIFFQFDVVIIALFIGFYFVCVFV